MSNPLRLPAMAPDVRQALARREDDPNPGYLLGNQLVLMGQPEVIGFGTAAFCVGRIERELANEIIAANHYSRKVYAGSYVHLGVYIDLQMVGVLQFGYAMNPQSMGSVVRFTQVKEYLELNRMWLSDVAPRNSESRALAQAIKFIRRRHFVVKWIQSFADERCGLFGTVYQASNFLFCGEHVSTFWELDGEWYHDILMTANRGKEGAAGRNLQANRDRAVAHELRQFRYLYFLKPYCRRDLVLPVLPYPKPDYQARVDG